MLFKTHHAAVCMGGWLALAVNTPCHPCPLLTSSHPPHHRPTATPPPSTQVPCMLCPAPTLTHISALCHPQKLQHLLESASKQALPSEKLMRVSLLRSAYQQRPTEEAISTIKEEPQPQ